MKHSRLNWSCSTYYKHMFWKRLRNNRTTQTPWPISHGSFQVHNTAVFDLFKKGKGCVGPNVSRTWMNETKPRKEDENESETNERTTERDIPSAQEGVQDEYGTWAICMRDSQWGPGRVDLSLGTHFPLGTQLVPSQYQLEPEYREVSEFWIHLAPSMIPVLTKSLERTQKGIPKWQEKDNQMIIGAGLEDGQSQRKKGILHRRLLSKVYSD